MLLYSEYKETVNESFDVHNMNINSRKLTVGQMTYKFKQLGYKFYGYVKLSQRHYNSFDDIGLRTAIPEDIRKLAYKFASSTTPNVKDTYLPCSPDLDGINIDVWGGDDDISTEDFNKLIHSGENESIEKATNKTGDTTFYVFFNNQKKYFYYIAISGIREYDAFLELYVKMKVSGEDMVRTELEERAKLIQADWEASRKEKEAKQAAQKKEAEGKDEQEKEIVARREALKEYVDKNKDKFKEIKSYTDLPDDFVEYSHYDELISIGRYDDTEKLRYVCNQDYTQLYKYKITNYGKSGTYWGD